MNCPFKTLVDTDDTVDTLFTVKNPRLSDSHENCSQCGEGESDLDSDWTRCHKPSATETQKPLNYSETRFQTPVPTKPISGTSGGAYRDQDQPLSFDRTRLAVATAAFRGSSVQLSSSETQSLARVLQSRLPNLNNSPSGQTFSLQSRDTENNDGPTVGLVVRWESGVQEHTADCGAAERIPEKSTNSSTPEERTGHVLGLGCYSSSDEDCDT